MKNFFKKKNPDEGKQIHNWEEHNYIAGGLLIGKYVIKRSDGEWEMLDGPIHPIFKGSRCSKCGQFSSTVPSQAQKFTQEKPIKDSDPSMRYCREGTGERLTEIEVVIKNKK